MPRVARIVVPGMPHHITQRGNNHQDVFFVDDDRRTYLRLLKAQSKLHGLTLLGYCLMTNHVHLIGIPQSEESLAKAVGRTHFLYSQYINRFHQRSGHLWQNRFFSCTLDEVHLLRALAYVERNPVRAKLARLAWQYEWSSASAHVGDAPTSELLDLAEWRRMWVSRPDRWRKTLRERDAGDIAGRLRRSTHTGRPLATDGLLSKLEHRLGRRLRPLPIGRPRKAEKPKRHTRGSKK